MSTSPDQSAMFDLVALRSRVRACRGRYAELAERADVSESWLSKFGRGQYRSPRVDTAQRLLAALDEIERSHAA